MSTNKMLAEYNSLKKEVEELRKKQKSKLQAKIDELKRERKSIISILEYMSEEDEEVPSDTERLSYFNETRDKHYPFWVTRCCFVRDGIYPFFFSLDKKIDASRTFCLKKNGRYYVNIFLRVPLCKSDRYGLERLTSKEDIPLLPLINEDDKYESKEFSLLITPQILAGHSVYEHGIIKQCKIVIKNKKVWLTTIKIIEDVPVDDFKGDHVTFFSTFFYFYTNPSKNHPLLAIKEECVSWYGRNNIGHIAIGRDLFLQQELFQK